MGPLEWVVLMLLVGVPLLYFAFRLLAGASRRQRRRECPVCAALIRRGTIQCPHCGHDFTAAHKP